jgi:hypothetical protein
MPTGQINRGSFLGDFLYEEAQKNYNKTFVEIGTWNGQGSTWCIAEGLLDSNRKDYSFYSLEIQKDFYLQALDFLPEMDNLFLILGKVTDDILDIDELDDSHFNAYSRESQKEWLKNDLNNLEKAPNVLWKMPKQIDLLVLDGSEFQGFQEWEILAPRSKIVILDDTNTLKFDKVKKIILNNEDKYEIIKHDPNNRQGFLIYKNK